MKRFSNIFCLFLILACVFSWQDASARKVRPRKGKADTAAVAAPKKKTPYEKFVTRKGMEASEGFMTIYRSGKDIWLEVPDSVVGRKVMLTSILRGSDSPVLPKGMNASSSSAIYQVALRDSMLLFLSPSVNAVSSDSLLTKAIAMSKTQATLKAFPIKYRNADSTSYVIKATGLFSPGSKETLNLRGVEYGNYLIYSAEYKDDLSQVTGLTSSANSVGIVSEATFKLTLVVSGLGLESADKPNVTLQIGTSLCLLPAGGAVLKPADDRIGTRKIKYTAFDSSTKARTEEFACRWNLSGDRQIKIYVDSLIPDSWYAAVKEGIEKWNDAFAAAGFGQKVCVGRCTAEVDTEDPFTSVVLYSGCHGGSVTGSLVQDSSTGEIYGCRILIPAEYQERVRKNSVYVISDVDSRYARYELEDSAVCDFLRTDIMNLFGLCLGLSRNAAGKTAYSPGQLRDPSFTAEYGIASSVTSGVIFNWLARPQDRDNGVLIISDRLGSYDKYAIEWLYSDFDKAASDAFIRAREGKPEYVFVPAAADSYDTRANKTCLGNDFFAAYDAGMSHLEYVAANGDKWLDDSVPEPYRLLFLDHLWLRYSALTQMLSSCVGAMDINDVREGSGLPKVTVLPVDMQRKAVAKIFDSYRDASWIDANRALLSMAGANKNVSDFTRANTFSLSSMKQRLPYVAFAYSSAGSGYSPEAFLADVQDAVLKYVRTGTIEDGTMTMLSNYLLWLISNSDIMKRNYAEVFSKNSSAFSLSDETNLVPGAGNVPASCMEGVDVLCYMSLKKARAALASCAPGCRTVYDRKCIEYLISVADAGLGNAK